MPIASTSLLSTVLAMAAAFLALSLLVQVIQECYKYLTSSRSKAYRGALIDFLGDKAKVLLESKELADLRARGPFQFSTGESKGHLEPMDKDDLMAALERAAPEWIQKSVHRAPARDLAPEGRERAGEPVAPGVPAAARGSIERHRLRLATGPRVSHEMEHRRQSCDRVRRWARPPGAQAPAAAERRESGGEASPSW